MIYLYLYNNKYILFKNQILDNLPVTWCYELEDGSQYCNTGFPMGCYKQPNYDNNLCSTILRVRYLHFHIFITNFYGNF